MAPVVYSGSLVPLSILISTPNLHRLTRVTLSPVLLFVSSTHPPPNVMIVLIVGMIAEQTQFDPNMKRSM